MVAVRVKCLASPKKLLVFRKVTSTLNYPKPSKVTCASYILDVTGTGDTKGLDKKPPPPRIIKTC